MEDNWVHIDKDGHIAALWDCTLCVIRGARHSCDRIRWPWLIYHRKWDSNTTWKSKDKEEFDEVASTRFVIGSREYQCSRRQCANSDNYHNDIIIRPWRRFKENFRHDKRAADYNLASTYRCLNPRKCSYVFREAYKYCRVWCWRGRQCTLSRIPINWWTGEHCSWATAFRASQWKIWGKSHRIGLLYKQSGLLLFYPDDLLPDVYNLITGNELQILLKAKMCQETR